MKLLWCFVFAVGLLFEAKSQLTPEYFSADTVKYDYRTGGRTDSIDFALKRLLSLSPAGGNELPNLVPTIDFFNMYRNGSRFASQERWLRPTFSGLPHVGMAYSFGAAATSLAQLNYQQVFAKQILLNLKVKNDRGATRLRNGTYRINEIDLLFIRMGKIWSTELDFSDYVNQSNLNNGLDTSADLSLFGLVYQPVERENAQSKFRTSDLRWKNFFRIYGLDSLTHFGITSESAMRIDSRKYSETDLLSKYYSLIQFDPLQTNDKFQWSQVMQQAGVYFKSKKFYSSLKGEGGYWKYYNQGIRDTVELNVLATVKVHFNKWEIEGSGKLNILGAGAGWQVKGSLLKNWTRMAWNMNAGVENVWANPQLRYYSANNYLYNNYASLQKQLFASLSNSLKFKINEKLNVQARLVNSVFDRNLFFDSTNWSYAGAFSIHQLTFRASWEPKFLLIQPEYTFTKSTYGSYIPQHYAKMRLMAKGRLFKAKKLLAWAGLDLHYFSKTSLLRFNPAIDVYVFDGTSSQNGMLNLHLFAGLQIDEFRFYVRYENLGYLWNNHSNELLENYPIPGGMLQVGITWDFFN